MSGQGSLLALSVPFNSVPFPGSPSAPLSSAQSDGEGESEPRAERLTHKRQLASSEQFSSAAVATCAGGGWRNAASARIVVALIKSARGAQGEPVVAISALGIVAVLALASAAITSAGRGGARR